MQNVYFKIHMVKTKNSKYHAQLNYDWFIFKCSSDFWKNLEKIRKVFDKIKRTGKSLNNYIYFSEIFNIPI